MFVENLYFITYVVFVSFRFPYSNNWQTSLKLNVTASLPHWHRKQQEGPMCFEINTFCTFPLNRITGPSKWNAVSILLHSRISLSLSLSLCHSLPPSALKALCKLPMNRNPHSPSAVNAGLVLTGAGHGHVTGDMYTKHHNITSLGLLFRVSPVTNHRRHLAVRKL